MFFIFTLDFAINNNKLSIPPPRKVPSFHIKSPYVFIDNEAFLLKPYLIKPYPRNAPDILERIFNYRLSRGRRAIDHIWHIRCTIQSIETGNHSKWRNSCINCRKQFGRIFAGNEYFPASFVDFQIDSCLFNEERRNEKPCTGSNNYYLTI